MIEPLLAAERLLVHGQLDQAADLYRRTLEADPRNSIAVVGLARVALERGDDWEAYRQACAALEIDPHNAAALRLEARLSEVLATRGEPVERPAWLAGGGANEPPPAPAPRPVHDTGPAPSAPAPPAAGPSESVFLARNPSMADHRRMEDATQPTTEPRRPPTAEQPGRRPPRRRPKGLLRRMLGL